MAAFTLQLPFLAELNTYSFKTSLNCSPCQIGNTQNHRRNKLRHTVMFSLITNNLTVFLLVTCLKFNSHEFSLSRTRLETRQAVYI